jgi:site-specific recombinase XerD
VEHEKRERESLRQPGELRGLLWQTWVIDFLKQRHAASPKTLSRKLTAWRTLASYLHEKKIPTPAHLTRQHCLDYVKWRKWSGNLRTKKRNVSINTVLLDLKMLGSIVQEAVRRAWIQSNPCYRLEIAREIPKQKPELSPSDIELIRAGIARKLADPYNDEERRNAEFLRVSFEIALAQGCRLFETYLELDDIDTENMEIMFLAKGRKRYTAPLSPDLLPLVTELRKRGQTFTYTKPRMPSLVWFKFLDMLRRKHPQLKRVSFHSTRVTVVSRLGRAGVPERVAMALVNHSSTTIHRIYRRVDRSELPRVWEALKPLSQGRHPLVESSGVPPSSPSRPSA